MDSSISSVVALIASSILIIVLGNAIQQLLFSPLSKIPGPFLAKISSYYIILIDAAGNRTRTIHSLHQQYGPIVRIGPNEVSFTSSSVVKEIYSQGTPYMKAPWYESMSLPPVGIFSLRDRRDHAARRRLLSHAFSQTALNDAEPMIAALVLKLVDRVRKADGQPVDMLQLFRRLSLDISGQLFLGQSFGALETEEPPEFLDWMDNMFIGFGIRYAFPLVYQVMRLLPVQAAQDMIAAPDRVAKYGKEVYFKYIEKNGRRSKRRDLLTKIIGANDEGGNEQAVLSDQETYLEVGNLLFAGTDTTSTTLTYLFWELAKNPEWQDRLREELQARGLNGVPKYAETADLPILDAVVTESLRLHPAAPASLVRSTPAGGRVIDGHFMPEGTVVSMQCYTTQRDAEAFLQPETWNPDRWLHRSGESNADDAKELFMPFSKGPRACLGQSLAIMELKVTVAAMMVQSRVGVAPGTNDEGMTMVDHFLVVPKAGKCDLQIQFLKT